MGNKLSNKGFSRWKRKKKKSKEHHGHDRLEESQDICESVLEIQDFYEANELNHKSVQYLHRNKDCDKAQLHPDYIPFESLTIEDLPDPIKHPAVFEYICARGNLVVFINVSDLSPNRKGSENKKHGHGASGYALVCEDDTVEGDCPNSKCPLRNSLGENHKVYGGILIMTNRHVIIDDYECEQSSFYFFYENGSPNTAKFKGKGFCLRDDSSENKDYVGVKIYLHDRNQMEQIRQIASEAVQAWEQIPVDIQKEFEKHTVVISHPHGWPKQVSFGELLVKELLLDENQNEDVFKTPADGDDSRGDFKQDETKKRNIIPGRRVSRYTSMTCTGSSGSPVLTGFYWNNPFVHSTGKVYWDPHSRVLKKIVGESYFY